MKQFKQTYIQLYIQMYLASLSDEVFDIHSDIENKVSYTLTNNFCPFNLILWLHKVSKGE